MYSAIKAAQQFAAAQPPVNLTRKQHQAFTEALARLLNEAYNAGYSKGSETAQYDDTR